MTIWNVILRKNCVKFINFSNFLCKIFFKINSFTKNIYIKVILTVNWMQWYYFPDMEIKIKNIVISDKRLSMLQLKIRLSSDSNYIVYYSKDVLLDRIEYEFLLYCSYLVANSSFLISNPEKYIWFHRDRTVKVPNVIDLFMKR